MILTNHQKRKFNPKSNEDLIALAHYHKYGQWQGGCPFIIEDPFIEVPAMCNHKIAMTVLEPLDPPKSTQCTIKVDRQGNPIFG